MPRILAFMIAMFLALMGAASAWAATDIKTVRVGKQDGNTRVVFEFTGKQTLTPQKVFTLQNPDRVVVDFPNTKFMQKVDNIALPKGLVVSNLRQGQFDNDTLRLVIDLTQPVKTSTFTIKATKQQGPRLVLDLIPTKVRVKVSQSVKKQPVKEKVETIKVTTTKPVPKVEADDTINITQSGGPIVIDQPTATPSIVATGKKRRDKIIVIIDPGHGGVDPGVMTAGKKVR